MKKNTSATAHRQAGSLLVELGIVLGVAGLVAGTAAATFIAVNQQQQQANATVWLHAAEAGIRTFVAREKRLPCPDTTGTGLEGSGAAGVPCPAGVIVGNLPYLSLGIEKPPLPKDRVMRYGVWRETPASDLAIGGSDTTAVGLDADGSTWLARHLIAAMARPDTATQPYVAARDAAGRSINCAAVGLNPAAALMIAPVAEPQGLCFSSDAEDGTGLVTIGKEQLLGWAQAGFR